jgi:hypothetical protein
VVPFVVALTLGTSRAAGSGTTVTVPSNASAVQLRVGLDPADRYDRYSVELRTTSDRLAWRGDDLRASLEKGVLTLVAEIPAIALSDGTYELAVRGVSGAAAPEDLGFVSLTVQKNK